MAFQASPDGMMKLTLYGPQETHLRNDSRAMRKHSVLSLMVVILIGSSSALAQRSKKIDLTPLDLRLTTKDGIELSGRFFPGRHEKQTVPIMILHGWKERASTYESLAKTLQSEEYGGHAVIVPDLRGHGRSTIGEDRRGRSRALRAEKLVKADFQAMVEFDVDTTKEYLISKHNEGLLNVDALCVVGSEMGAVLAMHWAQRDWSWPTLRGVRQGQDVKALVLLSPPQNFKGLSIRETLDSEALRTEISIIVFFGAADRRAASYARRVHGSIATFRPQKWVSNQEQRQKQNLFLVPLDTSLQGSRLLGERSLRVTDDLHEFIDYRLTRRMSEYPWKERKLPTLGE